MQSVTVSGILSIVNHFLKSVSLVIREGYGMTTLKRVMVSLPRDLEAAVEKLRRTPELRNVPVSQILCRLIRKGLDAADTDTKEDC